MNKKYKLKNGVERKNAVVHCPEEWMWDAVTEALRCDWRHDDSWNDYTTDTYIDVDLGGYCNKYYYRNCGYTIHNFHDIFEEVSELYDLTKIGRVPEGVIVEVSSSKNFKPFITAELLFISSEDDQYRYMVCMEDMRSDIHKYARHPQTKPEPKTRPMNFEEVCALVKQGAVFYVAEGVCVFNPKVTNSKNDIRIDMMSLDVFSHYKLPDDVTEHRLEMSV